LANKVKQKNKSSASHSGAGTIRIIGGTWRGRKIAVPKLAGLRPTPDRVRETLFNWLAPYLHGAHCLDLFSGTGALSIEALSRGAQHVTALESSSDAVQALKKTASLLQTNALDILHVNTPVWLDHSAHKTFDIVFIDPPFHQQLVSACCAQLEARGWLNTQALIYVEHERGGSIDIPDAWGSHRQGRAGDVDYALYMRNL
jgi:16S rRNA (guanine966-N2)-methyltransferase